MRKSMGCNCHCTGETGHAVSYIKPLRPTLMEDTINEPGTEEYEFFESWDSANYNKWLAIAVVKAVPGGDTVDVPLRPIRWVVDWPQDDYEVINQRRELPTGLGINWNQLLGLYNSQYENIRYQRMQRSLLPSSGMGHLVPNVPAGIHMRLTNELLARSALFHFFPELDTNIANNYQTNRLSLSTATRFKYLQIRINGEAVGPLYSADSYQNEANIWNYLQYTTIYFPAGTYSYNRFMLEGFEFEFSAGDEVTIDVWPRLVLTNSHPTGETQYIGYSLPLEIIDTNYPDELPRRVGFTSQQPYLELIAGVQHMPDFNWAQHTFRVTPSTQIFSELLVRSNPPQYFDVYYIGDDYAGDLYLDILHPDDIAGFGGWRRGILIKWGSLAETVIQYNRDRIRISSANWFEYLLRVEDIDGGVRIYNDTDKPFTFGTTHNSAPYDPQWDHFEVVPGQPFLYDDALRQYLHFPRVPVTQDPHQLYHGQQFLFEINMNMTAEDIRQRFLQLPDQRYHYAICNERPGGYAAFKWVEVILPAFDHAYLHVRKDGAIIYQNFVFTQGTSNAADLGNVRTYKKVGRKLAPARRPVTAGHTAEYWWIPKLGYDMTLRSMVAEQLTTVTLKLVIPTEELVELIYSVNTSNYVGTFGWFNNVGFRPTWQVSLGREIRYRCSSEDYVRYVKNVKGVAFDEMPEGVFHHLDETLFYPIIDSGWRFGLGVTQGNSILTGSNDPTYPPPVTQNGAWIFGGIPPLIAEWMALHAVEWWSVVKEDIV